MILKIEDKTFLENFFIDHWGAGGIVSRGYYHKAETLEGFYFMVDDEIRGLVTYHLQGGACEIVSLDSLIENQGIGTKLLNKVYEACPADYYWLITSNDNVNAMRFYQKRGFTMYRVHRNAINDARKIKPEIPLYGNHGIRIEHEVEFRKENL